MTKKLVTCVQLALVKCKQISCPFFIAFKADSAIRNGEDKLSGGLINFCAGYFDAKTTINRTPQQIYNFQTATFLLHIHMPGFRESSVIFRRATVNF